MKLIWVAATISVVACAADPGARRTRRLMSEQDEIAQGKEAAEQVEQVMGFSGSAELQAYVSRIGQRLVKHSERSHLRYEFHVVDMKEPNAFALPGGFIYISRGLLTLMNTEDELAAVLGHEIAHVAARHSVEQQARNRRWIPLQVLAGIGGAAASVVSPELGGMVAGAGQLPAALVMASYSRKQEIEADRLGQNYIAAEGWDPAALADSMDALTRAQELAGGRDPNQMSFFDSHPTTPSRSRDGRAYAKTLTVAKPNRIAVDRAAFVRRLDGLVIGDAAKAGIFISNLFVHPDLEIAMRFPKGWNHENAASVVLSYPKDESAVFALEVVGKGDDPAAAADRFEKEIPLADRKTVQVNGLRAVTGVAQASNGGAEVYAGVTWIAKDGLIYQLLGACPADRWSEHRRTFEAAAGSFRAPTDQELRNVVESRLRLVEARGGEALTAIAKRGGNNWSPARVAAANAMKTSDKPRAGEPIKISKRERYQP